jgi:hypothetical protein
MVGRLSIGTALVMLCMTGASAETRLLLKTSFEAGAEGWTKQNQAFLSDLSRRKGTKSLLIKQWKDEEQSSHWLSPPLPNPGKPVKISFWAADNYLVQRDFTYAATVDLVSYDKAGKELETTWYLRSIPWDDTRKSDLWGKLTQDGLVWKYYEAVHRPRGETFKIKFHWRKPLLRGECALTDLLVTEATDREAAAVSPNAAPAKADADSPLKMQISTPAMGNLFYADDPIRMEVLIYADNPKALEGLTQGKLKYEVSDFEHLVLARGESAFDNARPVSNPTFYKSRYGKKYKHNLLQPLVLEDDGAKRVGRELFINIVLENAGKVIASDTVTYGVVNPRKLSPADYDKSRFVLTYFTDGLKYEDSRRTRQSISAKTGTVWSQTYDYGWKRVQPKYPGPYNFGKKRPALPRITYCPNIEQERSQEKWIRSQVPPECVIPDPLRSGKFTFKIDPYVEYIVAYIRHHRQAIARVVPSGLERPIDARTIELHKKAYKAIKAEWPELPVGFMPYGLVMNPSQDVEIIIKNRIYDFADFYDTHVYASSVDWTEWKRLQSFYRTKLKREPPPLYSTEFCKVGGADQVLHSRDTILAHLDAFAHGMHHIYYFNQCNEEARERLSEPFLREPTDLGSGMTSGFMYMQRVNIPRVSAAATRNPPDADRWGVGSWGWEYGGDTLMPVLQAMTYYNLVQNFDLTDYRATFHPTPNTIAYIFDRGDQTICALWLERPAAPQTIVVRGDTPYVAQDLFGRNYRITPVGGASLVSVSDNPLTLIFDKRVELFDPKTRKTEIQPVDGGLRLPSVARGAADTAQLTLPAVFNADCKVTVKSTVDGTWPDVSEKTLEVKPGALASLDFPLRIPMERKVGAYPFVSRLLVKGNLIGLLKAPLEVNELLNLSVTGIPMTVRQAPAIEVTISSLAGETSKGSVSVSNIFFAEGFRPAAAQEPFSVPAKGKTRIRFAVPRNQVNMSTTYEVKVDLETVGGIRLSHTEEIAFRATPKAPGPIAIDGDLKDWDLKNQIAIPFAREFTGWGKRNEGAADLSGVFYTLWDDEYLYFAADIKDSSAVTRANDINIWMDDNIMLGFYPWGWKHGEKLNAGYYREHLGNCKDGTARIFRVGNVAVGPTTAAGAKISVRRTTAGYFYEWAYPKACIAPMKLEANARFRLSLFPWDTDKTGDEKKPYSKLGGIQFGGFNANVDARPSKWREFVLTKAMQ